MEQQIHEMRVELEEKSSEIRELRETCNAQATEFDKLSNEKELFENEISGLKNEILSMTSSQRDMTSQLNDIHTRYVLLLSDGANVQEKIATLTEQVTAKEEMLKSKESKFTCMVLFHVICRVMCCHVMFVM